MAANEIVTRLFLGNMEDAHTFDGERLCVLEGQQGYPGMTHHIPILVHAPAPSGPGFWASRAQLDLAAALISARLEAGVRLLVHCGAWIERSPLTVAWWLTKTDRYDTLASAYLRLKELRPIVEDRTVWLEPGVAV